MSENEVGPDEVLGCVVAALYGESGEAGLARALLALLDARASWSAWAALCGPAAVLQLETRLALRSLDEFLDLCEELSAWSEKGLFRHAALPLLVRRTALRLRRQEFHESVATYEQLVAWLRGAELPNANPNSNHNLNLNHHPNHNSSSSSAVPGDVEAERAERAARAERAGVGAAETALLALRAQPSAALARETAALAAELGDEQLMRAASALLHSQRHNNTDAANRDNHTDAAANRANNTDAANRDNHTDAANRANNTDADPELRAALLAATAPQTDLLLRALEQRDAAFFLQ